MVIILELKQMAEFLNHLKNSQILLMVRLKSKRRKRMNYRRIVLERLKRGRDIFSIETIKNFCNENNVPMVFKECPEDYGFKIAILKEHEEIVNDFLYYKKPVLIGVDILVVNKIEKLNQTLFLEENKNANK
jgi:hypothetical protein